MTARSVLLPRTTLTLIASAGLTVAGAVALGTGWAASASPDDPHKVWVCKFVQTPHEREVLKQGKNPIFVDWASLTGKADAPHVGDTFSDAHDMSVVVQIGGTNPGVKACGVVAPPTTTTHTPPMTTTHTPPMTTTHTPPMTTTPMTTGTTVPPGGGGGGGNGDNGGVGGGVGGVVDHRDNVDNGAPVGPVPGFGAPDTGGTGDTTPIGLLVGPALLAGGVAVAAAETARRRREKTSG